MIKPSAPCVLCVLSACLYFTVNCLVTKKKKKLKYDKRTELLAVTLLSSTIMLGV